jgi:uncharacterized protein YjbI with pentapeptide repeats
VKKIPSPRKNWFQGRGPHGIRLGRDVARAYKPIDGVDELVQERSTGRNDFSNAKLHKAFLRSSNLISINLSGADLSGADLGDALLFGAKLLGADLKGANLSGANLSGGVIDPEDPYGPGGGIVQLNVFHYRPSFDDLLGLDILHGSLRIRLKRDSIGGVYPTNLSRANLSGARLVRAALRHADLRSADLSGADLTGADLSAADLEDAILVDANLSGTLIHQANLHNAKLAGVTLDHTHILDVDLSTVCSAQASIKHEGPSTIDFRSIVRSGQLPGIKEFLQKAGMPEVFVEYMIECASTINGSTIKKLLQSTFLSFGEPDGALARRLYEALRRNGVTTFFFPKHAKPGQRISRVIREGIESYDRVLLLCSKASLARPGVLYEIEETLERERRSGGAEYLIPVELDDCLRVEGAVLRKDVVRVLRDRVCADFRGAEEDKEVFGAGLLRLIAALRK